MWAGDRSFPTQHVRHHWYEWYKAIVEERKKAKREAKTRAKK
jgi:hypothetical protein